MEATYPVFDGHNDLLWEARNLVGYDWDRLDLKQPTETHTDIPRLRRGGVAAQFWSVYVPSNLPPAQSLTQTFEQVDAAHAMIARYSNDLELARTADDVERIVASGKIASLLGAEGGHQIGESLGVLRMLYRLGVRYLTLTHNDSTPWADSATDKARVGGLNDFGREVVREMNRIGMLVDLSHVSTQTMHAALDVSTAPAIFSHSSARALCDSPRNVPDDVLAKLADNDGTCMATFVPDFVNQDCWDWRVDAGAAAAQEGVAATDLERFVPWSRQYAAKHPKPEATLQDVVAHVEHLREAAGVDHIGLGGDYDGTPTLPAGLQDVSKYPDLFTALRNRHWSAVDLIKLAGGNVLRSLRGAEAKAE